MDAAADYFLLAHCGTSLARERYNLRRYIASLKHALLFTRSIALADTMVVNSPNFRRAFHEDTEFRRVIMSGLVEIIHFEKFVDGRHFTLRETRQFNAGEFRANGGVTLFQPAVPAQFRTSEFDDELDSIQSDIPQKYPDAANRDPYFSQLVKYYMDQDFLKADLGDLYDIYTAAYLAMSDDQRAFKYPHFGIIHFDPDHGDGNIFDYMARMPAAEARRLDKAALIKRIGSPVLKAHRALAINAELSVIRAKAILPPELDKQKHLVMATADEALISSTDREFRVEDIDLGAFTIDCFAALTLEDILEIRKMGVRYFDMIESVKAGTMQFSEALSTLKEYIQATSLHLYRLHIARDEKASRPNKISLLYGSLVSWASHPGSMAAVIKVAGSMSFFHVIAFMVPQLADNISKYASPILTTRTEAFQERRDAKFGPVRAEIVYDKADYLTQYKR